MRMLTFLTVAVLPAALAFAQQVKLPPYKHEVLPNGVVVNLMRRGAGVPLVEFRLAVRGGEEADPIGMAGLSSITAELLRRGTKTRTADQFSEQLDSLGGNFGALSETGVAATTVNALFLAKDLAAGLDLFADAVLNPTFPEAEVTKLLKRRSDSIKSTKDALGMATMLYFRAFYYGPNHPYGRITTEATLEKIDRTAIADFHKRLYCGRNMVLTLAGDFDEQAAMAAVQAKFGGAPAGIRYAEVASSAPEGGKRLLLVDKPDATQTYFEIGMPGVSRNTPDRFVLQILNTLFGGRFTSILNDELRVNTGLTYGANSILERYRMPGAIYISTFTKTDSSERAIDTALALLKKFHDQGISAEQLTSAKAYIKGEYPPRRLETASQLASVLNEIEIFGTNRGEVDDFFSAIDSVTLETANAAAKKYYSPETLTFTVLGNAAKLRPFVSKYAPKVVEVDWKTPGFPVK